MTKRICRTVRILPRYVVYVNTNINTGTNSLFAIDDSVEYAQDTREYTVV